MGIKRKKLVLVLEYEGSAYSGFQRQDNALTVQAVIEDAIYTLSGEQSVVKGAGRTDAGVHALGQVATFEICSRISTDQLRTGINHFLPQDVAVKDVQLVPRIFDARRHALSRVYRYTLFCGRDRSPFLDGTTYRIRESIELRVMEQALSYLEGVRDFAPFSGPLGLVKSTIRELFRTKIWPEGDLVHIELEGSSFLRQQVRRTIGALLQVGTHKLSLEQFKLMADSGVRGSAHWVAPARGLCLLRVNYDMTLLEDRQNESDDDAFTGRSTEFAVASY
jgi:tRNA pseudouridine38-40 synthase